MPVYFTSQFNDGQRIYYYIVLESCVQGTTRMDDITDLCSYQELEKISTFEIFIAM